MDSGSGDDWPAAERGGDDAGSDDDDGANATDDSDPTDPEHVFRTRYDAGEEPTTAVVRAVAAVTGRQPSSLPPLYEDVDVEALDAFVGADPDSGDDAVIRFTYASVWVEVTGDGRIEVRTA